MANLTYAELFAGAGGMSLGLEAAGWTCVAHAEIEPHARAVLRKHWPDVPLHGDVSELDGAQFQGITMLTGGSPCQDLSIAGKRKGLEGERSGLFHQQVRIWRESGAPYILWENVLGALSSNKGEDFGVVLSTIVGGAVPVPADGWRGAGVASGPAGVAAWRVLDARFFGVPQRRRRIFVLGVADGSVDPAEVLSLSESLSGHPAPRREAGEGIAADSGAGVDAALNAWDSQRNRIHGSGGIAPTLQSPNRRGQQQPAVLTYDTRGNGDGQVVNTMAGDHQNRVTDYTAIVLRNREGKPGGGKGPLLSAERKTTLGTANDQVVFPAYRMVAFGEYTEDGTASALKARDYKDATDLTIGQIGIPRRLTPVECERLMGWPDQHTAHGINEKGNAYALADTARYKLCGNGIASPVVQWIGMRLKMVLDAISPTQ